MPLASVLAKPFCFVLSRAAGSGAVVIAGYVARPKGLLRCLTMVEQKMTFAPKFVPKVCFGAKPMIRNLKAVLLTVGFGASAFAGAAPVYLAAEQATRQGAMPACTALEVSEGRRAVSAQDSNKSWPKLKFSLDDYAAAPKFESLGACLAAVPAYAGRYTPEHVTSLQAGQLAPGMPLPFALMVLGPPSQAPSMHSYLDPSTGMARTTSIYLWTGQKRRSMLGSALTIAGAATGRSAAAGAVAATQAASVATTAAAAAYTVSGLKAAQFVSIQVDDQQVIQTFSAN